MNRCPNIIKGRKCNRIITVLQWKYCDEVVCRKDREKKNRLARKLKKL